MFCDETTHILKIQTGKRLYKQGTNNTKKITKKELKQNFFGALNINGKSIIYPIKNLTQEIFAKTLVNLRTEFTEDKNLIKILKHISNNMILSKKEIREIISANSPSNENFVDRLLRSLKNNIKDDEATLSRKLGKHCKRESTENPNKQKEIKYKHILDLLNHYELTDGLKKEHRLVLIVDNVPVHTSDFIFEIVKKLNIYLLFLPEYSPDLNAIEGSWDYSKIEIKRKNINTVEELVTEAIRLFNEITKGDSLYKTLVERFLPQLL